jgi:NAD(P)-dependent dehydrogenase (short-subunit alcohol dehydrogenase family)
VREAHVRLRGKRALGTGGGSGIRRATAHKLAREGARVAVVDRADNDVAAEIGEAALDLRADVADEGQVAAAVDRAAAEWGGLDVLVANAAVQLHGEDDRADRLDLDVWRRTLDVNLTGAFLACKHGIRALLATGGGAVVCTASPTGLYGLGAGYDAYSSSKAGVYGLVRVLAADYAREGIRVNGVVPGYTATPLTEAIVGEEHEALLRSIPLGRQGTAGEVANVIAFLVSDEASYVTGAVWAADGGITAV